MASRQVNIRLPEEEALFLDAAAYVEGLSSVAEFLRPEITRLVEGLRQDPDVQAAVRIRVERAAAKDGKLTRLQDRRRGAGGEE